MSEDAEDRAETARMLAEAGDSRAAAKEFRAIATDGSVDDTVRLEAARGLAEIDERAAAETCCSIAADGSVDDTVRLEAAMLAEGDSRWAAAAFRAITADGSVDATVRQEAARGLAEIG
jgi:HEAT repeat protein